MTLLTFCFKMFNSPKTGIGALMRQFHWYHKKTSKDNQPMKLRFISKVRFTIQNGDLYE